MFPDQLADKNAFRIAQALIEGFNRHYRLFRETSAAAKRRFEAADWHGQQRAQRERIEFYDQRVNEAVSRLRSEFSIDALSMDTWQQVKLHYIGLLKDLGVTMERPETVVDVFSAAIKRYPRGPEPGACSPTA